MSQRQWIFGLATGLSLVLVFNVAAAEGETPPAPPAPAPETPGAVNPPAVPAPDKEVPPAPPLQETPAETVQPEKPATPEYQPGEVREKLPKTPTELFVGDEPVIVGHNSAVSNETSEHWDEVQALVKKKLEEAKKAYKAGNYQKAVNLAREILNLDRRNLAGAEMLHNALGKQSAADDRIIDDAGQHRDDQLLNGADEDSVAPPVRGTTVRPRLPRREDDVESAKRKRMNEKLADPVTVDFMKADLEWVLNTLFIITNVNIIADQAALEGKSLTLHVDNLPLREVLEFIVRNNEGIQYSVTEDAIWITASEEKDLKHIMFPRVYPLHHGLVSTTEAQAGGGGGGGGGGAGGAGGAGNSGMSGAGSRSSGGSNKGASGGGGKGEKEENYLETVLKWMKEAKDPQMFPEGSDYMVDKQTNQLIVFTTPSGHEVVRKFLDDFDEPPIQVLIKTRFITVSSDDESALGFNASFNSTNFSASTSGNGSTSGTSSTTGTTSSGSSGSTSGTSTSSGVSGVNNLHQAYSVAGGQAPIGIPGTLGPGNVFQFVGSRTNPQFQVTVAALLNNQRSRVLSEPMILAINNKEATIYVGTKFNYISQLTPITTSTVVNGVIQNNATGWTPTWATMDLGFHLNVTPSVGRDLRTINLHLAPDITSLHAGESISEFQNFQLNQANSNSNAPLSVQQPTTDETTFENDVVMEDNGFVILGGLVSTDRTVQENKFPGLWKIPYLGTLFKSTSFSLVKSNLIIIVEAQIVTPGGRTYYKDPQIDDGDVREGSSVHSPGQVSEYTRPASVNSALGLSNNPPQIPSSQHQLRPDAAPAGKARKSPPLPGASPALASENETQTANKKSAPTPRERMERLARLSQQANTAELAERGGWLLPPEEESQPASKRSEAVPVPGE
jgi:type II secretory pathway component GspD/PulD (secretin)